MHHLTHGRRGEPEKLAVSVVGETHHVPVQYLDRAMKVFDRFFRELFDAQMREIGIRSRVLFELPLSPGCRQLD
jgi:hypothetical protein